MGSSYGPARADLYRDMADFDLLPVEVQRVVRDAPVNFKAGTILAVWRLHEFDGGDVRGFIRKLRRKMRAALSAIHQPSTGADETGGGRAS